MDHLEKPKYGRSIAIAFGAVGVLALIHLVFWLFQIDKGPFALGPQNVDGLLGILTSPFLHADYEHLFLNSGPLLMFLAGMLIFYPKVAFRAIIGIWILTGMWVWILAGKNPIIGASGVVYGLGGFLFFSGIFRRDARSVVLSLIVAVGYHGMISGIFKGEPGISWESHLSGAVAGLVMAFFYRKVDTVPRKRYSWEDEPEENPNDAHAVWNYQQTWPEESASDELGNRQSD